MINKNKIIILLSVLIFGCIRENNKSNSFSSDSANLTIGTEKKRGLGEFPISFGELSNFKRTPNSPWEKVTPDYTGIPDTLQNLSISTNPLNWEQFVFQSFNSEKIDSSFFGSLLESWEMDITKLCPKEIKTFFSIAIGQNSNEEWVYVLDQNNNLDFSDDKLNTLITIKKPFGLKDEEIQKESISFKYEVFNEKQQILKDSTWVFVFKDYSGNNSFFLCEYRAANIKIGEENYTLKIKSPSHSLDYSKYSELGVSQVEGNIPKKHIVKIGEYLILNDGYYKADKITTNGDKIFLSRDLDAEKNGGTQLGMKAIDFKAQTLDGEKIKLSNYKGKYVLLDFWGTWCKPCVGEIETLEKINSMFSHEDLAIIGIANDSKQKLSEFLEERPLPWVQIPQYKPDNDSILNTYHVSSFPTTFLLDKSGKIIDKNLRGKNLIYKLELLLITPDSLKANALKGSTKFILNGNQDADAVFARVYSKDNPEDDWTIRMYKINKKWIGSEDLKQGNYTYEFIIDGNRIKDPENKDSKYTEQGDREISILQIKDENNLL